MDSILSKKTFTYVIDSNDRISGANSSVCDVVFNGGFDPKFRYYACEVACLVSYNHFNTAHVGRFVKFKCSKDIIHSNFRERNDLSNDITLATFQVGNESYSSFRGGKFIIKNLAGFRASFTEYMEDDIYQNGLRYNWGKLISSWSLYLYLTPLNNDLTIYEPIFINPFNCLTCYICSIDRENASEKVDDCYIRMPYVNSQYKKLKIYVQGFMINYNSIKNQDNNAVTDESMSVRCYDLINDGWSTLGGKLTYLCSLPVKNSDDAANGMFNDRGSIFECENFSNKIIKFQLYDQYNTVYTSGPTPHARFDQNGYVTNWILQLLICPI